MAKKSMSLKNQSVSTRSTRLLPGSSEHTHPCYTLHTKPKQVCILPHLHTGILMRGRYSAAMYYTGS